MQPRLVPLITRLRAHAETLAPVRIENLFSREPQRLERLRVRACGLTLDLSKQGLDERALDLLLEAPAQIELDAAVRAMFSGASINTSEYRPVLHTALRAGAQCAAGADIASAVAAVLARMREFVGAVRDGRWHGFSGERIVDIVNIGIGGSYLGPQLVCDALRQRVRPDLRVHFLANVDGGEFARVVTPLDPATTLFIVASKSFSTVETRMNADSARAWLAARFADPAAIARHFVAVSAAPERACEFGIDTANVYPLWDWVGGRYSVWSAIGLPVALALGMPDFERFLHGAHALDQHFRTAPVARNLPVMLALTAFWNTCVLGAESYAIVPYDDRLRYLPEFLQQLEMESNGKRVTSAGQVLSGHSAPITWGGLGTNAQHAFFQLLHQGTRLAPVDFVLVLQDASARRPHHDALVANCLAQAEALMRGRAVAADEADAAHKVVPGNRPNTLLLMDELEPATLGALLALYEHKTFVLSSLLGINAFDQWGVELGKVLAGRIEQEIARGQVGTHDPSTAAALRDYLAARTTG